MARLAASRRKRAPSSAPLGSSGGCRRFPVRFVDPELAADPEAIRRVDAFLIREANGELRQAVYLNRRSSMVEKAIAGRDIDIGILAAVIRHEVEHLHGAGERDARLREG